MLGMSLMECSVLTCTEEATHTEGVAPLCRAHYMLWRRYGYVGTRFPSKCTVDGCNANHTSGGYCSKHYRLVRDTGSTEDVPRKNARQKCKVEGCDRWRSSYGLCALHHARKLAETRPPVVYPGRICAWCEDAIPETRPADAIFCSSKCKQYAMNERQRVAPDAKLKQHAANLRKFKITPADFDRMLEEQGGRCAICGTTEPRGRGRFHVDHDHTSNVVRGLLCTACNTGLGLVSG